MDRRADTLSSIVVEFAKETRPRRDPYEADRLVRARRPPGFRLIVSGISRDTSWQVRVFLLLVGFFLSLYPTPLGSRGWPAPLHQRRVCMASGPDNRLSIRT